MKPLELHHHYLNLGKEFAVKTQTQAVAKPELIKFNYSLATELGLADTSLNPINHLTQSTAIFSGSLTPEGAQPVAMAYAGHQFGHFNPRLGDGRALLLGEITTPNGALFDLQLKGSGTTHFSRNGDGRAALGPILREYLLSEAMAKLGVATTRALAMVSTGEQVARETLLPGGIITRISKSFVRVGTFQYFSATGNISAVKKLADFIIKRSYSYLPTNNNIYVALLQAVIERQATLISQWMLLGFIHGVMNTDNMSVAGETIDYGPCAFMDFFDFNQVYSSIDRHGRYAYNNQAEIGLWNLTRFAESLLPLLAPEIDDAVAIAQDKLKSFAPLYQKIWLAGMREKLGLAVELEEDEALIDELLKHMATQKVDFTLTFYHLSRLSTQSTTSTHAITHFFKHHDGFKLWLKKWFGRLAKESDNNLLRQQKMQAVNPVYIPRNHQIEAAIRAGEDCADFSVFHRLHEVLQNPYREQAGKENYQQAPKQSELVTHTFCGT